MAHGKKFLKFDKNARPRSFIPGRLQSTVTFHRSAKVNAREISCFLFKKTDTKGPSICEASNRSCLLTTAFFLAFSSEKKLTEIERFVCGAVAAGWNLKMAWVVSRFWSARFVNYRPNWGAAWNESFKQETSKNKVSNTKSHVIHGKNRRNSFSSLQRGPNGHYSKNWKFNFQLLVLKKFNFHF